MVALLMRAWVVMMKGMGVVPSLLVDDILILASGENMKETFRRALEATHGYLLDMGATVAPDKSHVFATTGAMRKWLKGYEWPGIGKGIRVVQQFKYLGGANIGDELAAHKGTQSEVCQGHSYST